MVRFSRSFFFKRLFLVLTDSILAISAFFLTLILSNELRIDAVSSLAFLYIPISIIVITATVFISGTHRIFWRHAGFRDAARFSLAVFVGDLISLGVFYAVTSELAIIGLLEILCSSIVSVCLSLTLRMYVRYNAIRKHRSDKQEDLLAKGDVTDFGRSLIVGAGIAAERLLRAMFVDIRLSKCIPVALVDDNDDTHGALIRGVPVVGGRDIISEIVEKERIRTIFFAIPSATPSQRRDILKICSATGCDVRIMHSVDESFDSSDTMSRIRKVSISDLLGRESVNIDVNKILGYVKGKTVLVTGGGGSIGSEICRQVAQHSPKRLIIFDIYENSCYDILNELKRSFPELEVVALIGSVREEARLNSVFEQYRPDIVYHAAAHKHVPLMEDSPHEAVKNNVFGTLNTVRASDRYGVERFVMISTDKAVNPTNVMGATKRLCEMIIQTYNNRSKTEYVAVRFGNVLGSNGSVIPLFERQIQAGGPVTVTHPDIIRYFMTIPEAVSLVLSAGAFAKGGEIFVLDMGEPVKIIDLAENMIRLSGFEPYHDIDIKFTGLRPGEKLYEELLMDEEGLTKTDNSLIYVGRPISLDEEKFLNDLNEFKRIAEDNSSDIRKALHEMVPTFKENLTKKDNV